MERRFEGKIAVITGGASGIGEAIARRLGREGAAVLVADVDADRGPAVASAIETEGGRAGFCRADVTLAADCEQMVKQAVERWGGLDILVNSAGVGEAGPIVSFAESAWDRVLDVNLKGTYLCCKAALPALAARGGSIVNLASLAGLIVAEGMGAYAASKAGVIQLTRAIALEGARDKVRANALCPTWVDTPMVQGYLRASGHPEQARRGLEAMIPLGRLGAVEDVAAAALFLASDEAAFITGVALPVDGGTLCGRGHG